MLKAAYRRAEALVAARRSAIRRVADEMLAAADERVSGARLVEIIEVGSGSSVAVVRGGGPALPFFSVVFLWFFCPFGRPVGCRGRSPLCPPLFCRKRRSVTLTMRPLPSPLPL